MWKIGCIATAFLSFGVVSGVGADDSQFLLASIDSSAAGASFDPEADAGAATEAEAKMWVLNAGYDQVSGLQRDENRFYHGTALLDGSAYSVVVDVAGNVLGLKE